MITRLTALTALEVLVFVGALVVFLRRIVSGLEAIGGSSTSSLAKISFGVRAIAKETSHLPPQVEQLNEGLTLLNARLGQVNSHLAVVDAALSNPGTATMEQHR